MPKIMKAIPYQPRKVAKVFDGYPADMKRRIVALRKIIYKMADQIDGVGELEETLKWGSPSYLTNESQSGTTVRIDRIGWQKGKYGIFVHCQSKVVEQFKKRYDEGFEFDGDRGLVLDVKDPLPVDAVQYFVYLALTYHMRK